MHTSHHRFESVYVGSSAGPARSSAAGVLVCVAGRLLVSGRDSSEASRRREGIRKWWRGTESNCRHYDFQREAEDSVMSDHLGFVGNSSRDRWVEPDRIGPFRAQSFTSASHESSSAADCL